MSVVVEKPFMVRVADLVPAVRNANKMRPETYALTRESIKQFGFLQNIVVAPRTDGRWDLKDGHHRRLMCIELGIEEVPAVVKQAAAPVLEALQLAMNRNRGSVDLAVAASVVSELVEEGWSKEELALTGFSSSELNDLLLTAKPPPPVEKFDAPPPEEKAPRKPRPWVLEIEFENKADLELVKKRLRRASGKSKDLAVGILRVLGEAKE